MKTIRRSYPIASFFLFAFFYGLWFAGFVLLLNSCATQKPIVVTFPQRAEDQAAQSAAPTTPTPAVGAPTTVPQPPPISVPVTQFNPPDNTPATAPVTTDKDAQTLVSTNNLLFDVHPQPEDYHGGAVVYNYVPNQIYQMFVAPLELTTLMLEPGEKLVSAPAAGDTSNFMVASTESVQGGQPCEQVLVKAVYAGKKTTIAINTDKRSYFFDAISYDKTFMPLISFNYPLELADKAKAQAALSANQILMFGRITDLDFAYELLPGSVHRPHWMPDRVFNDGKKTYISFPSASRAGVCPGTI